MSVSENQPAAFVELTFAVPLNGRVYGEVAAGLSALVSTMDNGRAVVIDSRRCTSEEVFEAAPSIGLRAPRLLYAPLGNLGLSTPDKTVLSLAAHGMDNDAINQTTGGLISPAKYLFEGIFEKLGVTTRIAAVATAWGVKGTPDVTEKNIPHVTDSMAPPNTLSDGRAIPGGLLKGPLPDLKIAARLHDTLTLLGLGYDNKQIADTMGISPGTIKTNLERLTDALGENDRTAKMAVGFGILRPRVTLPRKR